MHTDFDLVVGLTGLKAAGKDTFADVLAAKGFDRYRVSDAVRAEAKERGIESPTMKELQDIGDALRRETGDSGAWIVRLMSMARDRGSRKVVVNGVRNPGEIEALRREAWNRFVLVGIVAPTPLRFERFLKRRQAGDGDSMSAFLEMDDRDRGLGQPPEGQQVDRCLALVPWENVYLNAGTLEEYTRWINGILARHLATV